MKNIFSLISLAFIILSFSTVYSQKEPLIQSPSLKLLSGETKDKFMLSTLLNDLSKYILYK